MEAQGHALGQPQYVTYESGGVVVPHSLGVTESLKYRVSLDNLILQASLITKVMSKLACYVNKLAPEGRKKLMKQGQVKII